MNKQMNIKSACVFTHRIVWWRQRRIRPYFNRSRHQFACFLHQFSRCPTWRFEALLQIVCLAVNWTVCGSFWWLLILHRARTSDGSKWGVHQLHKIQRTVRRLTFIRTCFFPSNLRCYFSCLDLLVCPSSNGESVVHFVVYLFGHLFAFGSVQIMITNPDAFSSVKDVK